MPAYLKIFLQAQDFFDRFLRLIGNKEKYFSIFPREARFGGIEYAFYRMEFGRCPCG